MQQIRYGVNYLTGLQIVVCCIVLLLDFSLMQIENKINGKLQRRKVNIMKEVSMCFN